MKKVFLFLTAILALLLASCATTQNSYEAEFYYEKPAFLTDEPFAGKLQYMRIKRSDGRYWEIDLAYPTTLNLEAFLGEADNGFYLVYKEDYGAERFFFKEKHREPHLYEIESTFYYEGVITTSRKIKPSIRISKLTAEKICYLLEKEDLSE